MRIFYVMSAFNEEAGIRRVLEYLEKLSRLLCSINIELEVVAVDDGSTDFTWSILRKAARERAVKLHHIRINHVGRGL